MSCSMTTMVRSPTIRCSSSPVSSRSSALMPATVSSRNITFASCTSSMPTSSHCFCPWARIPAGRCGQRGQADGLQRLLDALGHLAAGEQQAQLALRCRPAAMSRFCSTLSCSNTVAVWKVRPIAEAHDLVRLHREQVVVAEHRLAGAVHQPGQGVDQGGLAGAVRADEEVQPPLQEGEVDAVDRLEAVEVDGQVADLEVVLAEERGGHAAASGSDGARSCRTADRRGQRRPFSFDHSEAMPPGRNRMTTMNSAPWK